MINSQAFRKGYIALVLALTFTLALPFISVLQHQVMAQNTAQVEWVRQFGTDYDDVAYDVAIADDGSSAYVVGQVSGTLPGQIPSGGGDAFIRKYDQNGIELWTTQFGTDSYQTDYAYGVAANPSGVYVIGVTYGTFETQTKLGQHDAFLCKFDSTNGDLLWVRQFGSDKTDYGYGICVDFSGVYVTGLTYGTLPGQQFVGGISDAFICKYDSDGNQIWIRQFGTEESDIAKSITISDYGIFVAGTTYGEFQGQTSIGSGDAFIRNYDASGNHMWTSQFGTIENDIVAGISAENTAVFVAGYTDGVFIGQTSQGDRDPFICSYDAAGNQLWISQFGTASSDQAYAVTANLDGVYVTGSTDGEFPGQTTAGERDIFVQNYGKDGNQGWCLQFGTDDYEYGIGISADLTYAYIAGNTRGIFTGEIPAGFSDAYIAKITIDSQVIINATIDINPDTLNLKSNGKWITCYIELPEDNDVADIDVSTVMLENTVYAEPSPTEIGDYDSDGIADLMVKFDRQEVIEELDWEWGTTYSEEIIINLNLNDGTAAEGSDTIKVLPKEDKEKDKDKK